MTGSESPELERAWAVLTPPRTKEFESFPLGVSFAGNACRAALDRAGIRHLLVPALGEGVPTDDRPAVLGTRLRRLSFSGRLIDYLDISCSEPDLFGEFDDVLIDVLQEIAHVERPASAAMRIVARWRKLFRSILVRELSRPAKIGLFGELTVLTELFRADKNFMVDAWRGPLKEPHDFEAPGGCIEVKVLGADGESIIVHGLAQLDTHDSRPLDLVLLRAVDDPDGLTVGDLVTGIFDLGADRSELRSRLAAVGWNPDPDRPDPDTFAVKEVFRVRVDGSTPRIVRSSFLGGEPAAGITDFRYGLELAALLTHATGASLSEIAAGAVR